MEIRDIERAAEILRPAKRVAVLTGAGISAESGVPTFRGPDGLWRRFRAEDLATPEAFADDPKLVWEWYDWRRGKIAGVAPNPGHTTLAKWERRFPSFTLITQNVDGLHVLAGSRHVLEIHGSLWRTRCSVCREVREDRRAPLAELPPLCFCEGLLRPDVVWFGETLPMEAWRMAETAAEESAVFLVVGTSSVVAPASSLGLVAARAGAHLFEINPEATPMAPLAEGVFRTSASIVLPEIARALGAG